MIILVMVWGVWMFLVGGNKGGGVGFEEGDWC